MIDISYTLCELIKFIRYSFVSFHIIKNVITNKNDSIKTRDLPISLPDIKAIAVTIQKIEI